jgi:hypothetical protein
MTSGGNVRYRMERYPFFLKGKRQKIKNPIRGNAKISTEDVIKIKIMIRDFGYGTRKISKKLGISSGAITGIVRGTTWKHVKI